MELREYLFRNRLSCVKFGLMVNYRSQYINEISRGVKMPGKKLVKLIESVTNGDVKEEDLRYTLQQRQKTKKVDSLQEDNSLMHPCNHQTRNQPNDGTKENVNGHS